MPKFTEADVGKRVILCANPDEGWAEERGTILGVDEESSTMVVCVDAAFIDDSGDDGNREVYFGEECEDDVEFE